MQLIDVNILFDDVYVTDVLKPIIEKQVDEDDK
jgi:hypothetical protein